MDISKVPAGLLAPRPIGPMAGADKAMTEMLDGSGGLRPSFADSLKGAIQDVNAKSALADSEVTALMTGQGSVHNTMIAMQDAAVSMDMVLAVRNKVLDAYTEVMRMPV